MSHNVESAGEGSVRRVLGFYSEFPTSILHAYGLGIVMRITMTVKPFEVGGFLPNEPRIPALVSGYHTRYSDTALYIAGILQLSNRIPHFVLRETLIHPSRSEGRAFLERHPERAKPKSLRKRLGENVAALLFYKHLGLLEITRGEPTRGQLSAINESLARGRIVPILLNETTEDMNPQPGVALMAKWNPDLNVFPAHAKGFLSLTRLKEPAQFLVGEPISFRNLGLDPRDKKAIAEFTRILDQRSRALALCC